MLEGSDLLSDKNKASIDSLSEDDLRFEIEKGKSSRYQGENYDYLKLRITQFERAHTQQLEDPLPAEPPKLLKHLKWLWIHGRNYKKWVIIAAIIAIIPFASKFLPISSPASELEMTLSEIHAVGPSKQKLSTALSYFDFIRANTSVEEAKRLMAFLRPNEQYTKYSDAISGSFGVSDKQSKHFEITIWKNSYNRSNVYGIRFGLVDSTYWGCNDSYMEIIKDINGNYALDTNPPFSAPCD